MEPDRLEDLAWVDANGDATVAADVRGLSHADAVMTFIPADHPGRAVYLTEPVARELRDWLTRLLG